MSPSLVASALRTAGFQPLAFDQWAEMVGYAGNQYGVTAQGWQGGAYRQEETSSTFDATVKSMYRRNGVAHACMVARMLLFAEARFQFRRMQNGRPGQYFGTQALVPLERPWPGATTGDLLSRMIQDADWGGDAFIARGPQVGELGDQPYTLRRLRPDWTDVVLGSRHAVPNADGAGFPAWWFSDADVLGYAYWPGGRNSGAPKEVFLPTEVAHFAPLPDPDQTRRGVSWLIPAISELFGDQAMTQHKLRYFEQGTTGNMVVTLGDVGSPQEFQEWVEAFEAEHGAGLLDAYKTIYLSSGSTVETVSANMESFKEVQGAGETRVCAAARVPPIIVGLSEGLQAATYSNYGMARRAFADGTLRPLWRNVAGTLQRLIDVPAGTPGGGQPVLWYDDRDIPFLQDDVKDRAAVAEARARTIAVLVREGFDPDTVVEAVTSEDFTQLRGAHSGMLSVQLKPPSDAALLSQNGNGADGVPAPAL